MKRMRNKQEKEEKEEKEAEEAGARYADRAGMPERSGSRK